MKSSDEIGQLSHSMQQMIEDTRNTLNDTSKVLEEIAKGNFDIKLEADYIGVFEGIEISINKIIIQLSKTMNQMLESMNNISISSKNIADIIKIIDNIASQTNLLALNIVIEAARAGESGKGFAVVAEITSTTAEESAAVSEELANQSNMLAGLIGQFKLNTND